MPLLYRIYKVTQARKYTVFPNMKTTFIAYCSMLLFCILQEHLYTHLTHLTCLREQYQNAISTIHSSNLTYGCSLKMQAACLKSPRLFI